jgi:hypothetical protein
VRSVCGAGGGVGNLCADGEWFWNLEENERQCQDGGKAPAHVS